MKDECAMRGTTARDERDVLEQLESIHKWECGIAAIKKIRLTLPFFFSFTLKPSPMHSS